MRMSRTIIEFGSRRWELEPSWGVLPRSLPAMPVAGVAVAEDGCVYALTRNHEHPIIAFDPDGRYMHTLGAALDFGSEHGISFAPDGCLWVCDSARHVAYKLTRRGEVVMQLGQKDHPCDNGFRPEVPYPHNLYTVRRAGEPFNLPTGVVETARGDIFACDGYGNASVHRFDREGRLTLTFGGPGDGPGQFRLPHALWVDGQDRVWVADRDNFRVEVFDRDGGLLRCFAPWYPRGCMYGASTLWGDGEYVFCCQNADGMLVFNEREMTLEGLMASPAGSPLMGHSMCGDGQGSLYIGHLDPAPMISRLRRVE